MRQLAISSLMQPESNPGRAAPLIHKWFARRRPEAIRTVLDGLVDSAEERSLRIMDPFVGSGMILLESLTQGHDVFGVDINPVAWLIARQTLNPPDIARVGRAFRTIDEAIGPSIRRLFSTATPMDVPSELVTGFYVRVVRPQVDTEVELHHNYLIARNRKMNWAIYYCPLCSAVFPSTCLDVVECSECQLKFDWRQGSVSRGRVTIGGDKLTLAELYKHETRSPQFKLIAVESYSPETGRQFHKPSIQDHMNVASAGLECLQHDIAREFHKTPIPKNRRDPRPLSHGFTNYGQLFAPRQLLSLALISDAIRELEDPEIRYTLALALSDAAGSNNRMCRYAADWLKLTPAFGLHGFHVVTRPVEGNVWGAGRGRGSFRNCVRKAIKAYNIISAAVHEAEVGRKSRPSREVQCLPAQTLSKVQWDPMDAIVTDPPYFDNLDYGELSDFYYQWLRIALKHEPPFDRTHSLDDSDLARIASWKRDPGQFSDELSSALKQAVAILKPTGVVAFSYHHSKSQAWECLADALRKAKIAPYKLTFVRSELDNGFHSSNGNIKTDAIFYCRRREMMQDVCPDNMISFGLKSLSGLDNLKPVDFANAGYAMAAALTAISTTEAFTTHLSYVRRIANWD